MGYTDKQSLTLAKTATMFQNIADTEISAGDAAKFINSQIKAFNMNYKDSESIIDRVNEVANRNAVGTNDLQLALTKAGSAMGTLGNNYNQTLGLVTAGTEIMVGQASKVGRGLRTVGINIGNMAKSTDTWEAANGKLQVALRDQNGDMRSTYDVMQDVAKEWGNLTKSEQNQVAVAAAGKRFLLV